jgi:galactonate dehydratase
MKRLRAIERGQKAIGGHLRCSRRQALLAAAALALSACAGARWRAERAARVTRFELVPVRATHRTVWLFVRLHTDAGLVGLGEASDAFGYANTTAAQAQQMERELARFAELALGASPLEVERYRARGRSQAAAGGLVAATAFSAIEQALWDLSGQLLGKPIAELLGGARRSRLPIYANINRATQPRTPGGFAASARRAVADGFRALKLAPFDGFERSAFADPFSAAPVELGIDCVAAVRDAIGPDVELMVDAHSLFDVPLAIEVAERLEPFALAWYEEPVAPELSAETLAIRRAIRQSMAGGEVLFGVEGFEALCRERAVDVIMPDPKHCGGVQELLDIAARAERSGIAVAPHNPSGPASTAVCAQLCAALPNFRVLELQWGEVPWRGELVTPPEHFERGELVCSERPGLGLSLDLRAARAHPI